MITSRSCCWLQPLLLLLLLACGNGGTLASSSSHCSTTISINRTAQAESTCNQTGDSQGMLMCGELQSALNFIVDDFTPNNSSLEDCVLLLLPDREIHYITAPLFLGHTSVHFVGVSSTEDLNNRAGLNGSRLQLPSVVCDYTVDVDLDRILELDYNYTDYVLYFNHSSSVSFQNIEMTNCPYPVRLNTVKQILIYNSLFT